MGRFVVAKAPREPRREIMFKRLSRFLLGGELLTNRSAAYETLLYQNRFAMALARAAATSALRRIDRLDPATWEFCGFSQSGEDGVIDYLCEQIVHKNRYFVEIGASNGMENNSSWL